MVDSTRLSASSNRRKRGVVLTPSGINRFRAAKAEAESNRNNAQKYTLETLSELTGVSIDTLTKVLSCEKKVDKSSLKSCFNAFGLELQQGDYYRPTENSPTEKNSTAENPTQASPVEESLTPSSFLPSPPGGPLPLGSSIYIGRSKAELDSAKAVEQPGSLLRVKGACRTGKTSLMARVAQSAKDRGLQPVSISFQLADKPVLQSLDRLLQWFCVNVGLEVGLSPNLETYWNHLFGSKVSCKLYFEKYILAMTQRPLVLILDDVELLFPYLDVADEFFGLLRTWYEDTKTSDVWEQLRIVMVQSPEVYIPLNSNKSPFNVGLAISIESLSSSDIQMLARAYGLDWSIESAKKLCRLTEGQPYLSHLAIDRIWRTKTTLSEVLSNPVGCQIFSPYLQYLLNQVKQHPNLESALCQVLANQHPLLSPLADIYRLQSIGLVVLGDRRPQIACQLFERYFSTVLDSQS